MFPQSVSVCNGARGSRAPGGYAAAGNSTRTSAPLNPHTGVAVGFASEAVAVLADDGEVRLVVQVDGFTAKRLRKERVGGEVNDARSLCVSGVKLHAGSIQYEADDERGQWGVPTLPGRPRLDGRDVVGPLTSYDDDTAAQSPCH